ncbi:hypothetical protein ACFFVB_18355 [Formosa undariae]|uniref:Uncharacterized protein n=1 Tax=Formosa undariae TaxID=1325436 RepID=A0ABV5F6P4_9FLAO
MSKALKITPEIAEKNPHLQQSGFLTSLPNKFCGVEKIDGGYANRTDLHDADGWRNVVHLPYDVATQNKANTLSDYINENEELCYAYAISDKTPEEITNYQKSLIPSSVKKLHFRLACIQSGVSLASIEAVIASIPDEALRETTLTKWHYAEFYEREDAQLNALATALGITETELDNIFILANEI